MATSQSSGWTPGVPPVHSLGDAIGYQNRPTDGVPTPPSNELECPVDAPLPNPSFVFPARPSSFQEPSATTGRPQRRRPKSVIEHPNLSLDGSAAFGRDSGPVALPSFSFNPGAAMPPDPHAQLLSPPVTPNSPRGLPSPSRPAGHGHRRGGSEFVGGRLREGNSIAVMSTSPTKSESGFASPGLQPPRHGHRRGVSGTISTSELPILLPPSYVTQTKGGSAPNSPTNFDNQDNASLPPIDAIQALPEPLQLKEQGLGGVNESEALPVIDESPSQTKSTKARVGFSDTLEYIPRPLSLVSTETSSTVTGHRGHSVSGSISSIVSAVTPAGRESPAPLQRSPTGDAKDSRPSTAGAILERVSTGETNTANASLRRRNSITALVDVPPPQPRDQPIPSPMRTSKRWSFFGLDALTGSTSPTKTRPSSSSSTESAPRNTAVDSQSDGSDSSTEMGTRKGKKRSKRKQMKGWAGSILPLMPKSHKKQSKCGPVRPPTPPASAVPDDENDEDHEQAEIQNSEPAPPTVTVTTAAAQAPVEADKRAEASQPMIDLDAALGPFNTPLPHNPEWEAAQQAAGNVGKRRMHSAQGLRGFTGPGMHYHRRAESAPALPPFDPGRSAISRFGSSSTMADVFEEEEEEEEQYDETKSEAIYDSDSDATPPASQENATPTPQDPTRHIRRSSSGLSDKDQLLTQTVRAECSKTSLQEEVIIEEPSTSVFQNVHAFQPLRESADSGAQSLSKHSSTKELSPVELGSPNMSSTVFTPASPYSTSLGSSHPSPRSPMSVDAQRISTAPSSVADEHSFQSLLMGEPGPEVRISVDYDVPSLSSSRSTMTRESVFSPNPRLSQPSLREQRPVSVSSSAFGRRRSSLVSLSRLISSSHGERSKLSMEVSMDDQEHKRSKDSKKRRLGRMMQFWKPNKDDATPRMQQ